MKKKRILPVKYFPFSKFFLQTYLSERTWKTERLDVIRIENFLRSLRFRLSYFSRFFFFFWSYNVGKGTPTVIFISTGPWQKRSSPKGFPNDKRRFLFLKILIFPRLWESTKKKILDRNGWGMMWTFRHNRITLRKKKKEKSFT